MGRWGNDWFEDDDMLDALADFEDSITIEDVISKVKAVIDEDEDIEYDVGCEALICIMLVMKSKKMDLDEIFELKNIDLDCADSYTNKELLSAINKLTDDDISEIAMWFDEEKAGELIQKFQK